MRHALLAVVLSIPAYIGCTGKTDRAPAPPATASGAGSSTSGAAATAARAKHVAELLVRLDAVLRERAPNVFARFRPGATEAQIADFERYLGFPMPATLAAIYRWHDGVVPVGGKDFPSRLYDGHWLASLNDVREMHAMRTGMVKDGTYASTDRGGAGWWDERWIPVFQNGAGGSLCVDVAGSFNGKPGQLVQEWHDSADRDIKYADIDAWLDTYVGALEQGLLREAKDEAAIWPGDAVGDEGPEYARWSAYVAEHNPGYPKQARAEGGH